MDVKNMISSAAESDILQKCIFFSHNYAKIKFDSCDSLPLEKTLFFHNIIKHINSVWNKDQNYLHLLPKNKNNK